jgi:transposase
MTRLAGSIDGVIGVTPIATPLPPQQSTRSAGCLPRPQSVRMRPGIGGCSTSQRRGFLAVAVGRWRAPAAMAPGSPFLRAHGEQVVEIGRPKRPPRRSGAKSDALDAIRAARETLAQEHPRAPRRRGDREALRVLLATRHSACAAKVSAINQLKALIVAAPEELWAELRGLATKH